MANRPQQFKSKAEFIRTQGIETPASDIIAAGKQAGLKIAPQDVHNVRFMERKRQQKAGVISSVRKPKVTINGKGKGKTRPKPSTDPSESEFKKLALRIGLDRAQRALDQLMEGVDLS